MTEGIISEIERNPAKVSLSTVRGGSAGTVICPYTDLDQLNDSTRRKMKDAGKDTLDDSMQWIVYESDPHPTSIPRNRIDLCPGSASAGIDFSPETNFEAQKTQDGAGHIWRLRKTSAASEKE